MKRLFYMLVSAVCIAGFFGRLPANAVAMPNTIELTTPRQVAEQKLLFPADGTISFRAKTGQDGVFVYLYDAQNTEQYLLSIGRFGGRATRLFHKRRPVKSVNHDSVIIDGHPSTYTLKLHGTTLTVYGDNQTKLLEYTGEKALNISYARIGILRTPVTVSDMHLGIRTGQSVISDEPIFLPDGTATFTATGNDIYIFMQNDVALSNAPGYWLVVGGWANSRIRVRRIMRDGSVKDHYIYAKKVIADTHVPLTYTLTTKNGTITLTARNTLNNQQYDLLNWTDPLFAQNSEHGIADRLAIKLTSYLNSVTFSGGIAVTNSKAAPVSRTASLVSVPTRNTDTAASDALQERIAHIEKEFLAQKDKYQAYKKLEEEQKTKNQQLRDHTQAAEVLTKEIAELDRKINTTLGVSSVHERRRSIRQLERAKTLRDKKIAAARAEIKEVTKGLVVTEKKATVVANDVIKQAATAAAQTRSVFTHAQQTESPATTLVVNRVYTKKEWQVDHRQPQFITFDSNVAARLIVGFNDGAPGVRSDNSVLFGLGYGRQGSSQAYIGRRGSKFFPTARIKTPGEFSSFWVAAHNGTYAFGMVENNNYTVMMKVSESKAAPTQFLFRAGDRKNSTQVRNVVISNTLPSGITL